MGFLFLKNSYFLGTPRTPIHFSGSCRCWKSIWMLHINLKICSGLCLTHMHTCSSLLLFSSSSICPRLRPFLPDSDTIKQLGDICYKGTVKWIDMEKRADILELFSGLTLTKDDLWWGITFLRKLVETQDQLRHVDEQILLLAPLILFYKGHCILQCDKKETKSQFY